MEGNDGQFDEENRNAERDPNNAHNVEISLEPQPLPLSSNRIDNFENDTIAVQNAGATTHVSIHAVVIIDDEECPSLPMVNSTQVEDNATASSFKDGVSTQMEGLLGAATASPENILANQIESRNLFDRIRPRSYGNGGLVTTNYFFVQNAAPRVIHANENAHLEMSSVPSPLLSSVPDGGNDSQNIQSNDSTTGNGTINSLNSSGSRLTSSNNRKQNSPNRKRPRGRIARNQLKRPRSSPSGQRLSTPGTSGSGQSGPVSRRVTQVRTAKQSKKPKYNTTRLDCFASDCSYVSTFVSNPTVNLLKHVERFHCVKKYICLFYLCGHSYESNTQLEAHVAEMHGNHRAGTAEPAFQPVSQANQVSTQTWTSQAQMRDTESECSTTL